MLEGRQFFMKLSVSEQLVIWYVDYFYIRTNFAVQLFLKLDAVAQHREWT